MLMGYPLRITVVILWLDMQKRMQTSRKRSISQKGFCEKRRELTDPTLNATEKCRKLTDPTHFAAKMFIGRPANRYFLQKWQCYRLTSYFLAQKSV
jgi:hypothetical protein